VTVRRRGAELEEAVLRAAAEVLTEAGYAGLTMDAVALRAGTSKNVIYRRWPSRAALSVAAYLRLLPTDPQLTPDTGALRTDALALLTRANERMAAPAGKILRELVTDLQDDPERARELRDRVVAAGVEPWLAVVARAVERGEAGPAALAPRVATVAVDLLRNEFGLYGVAAVPAETIAEIVERVYVPLIHSTAVGKATAIEGRERDSGRQHRP
jgi:AcrR family transcriptional regulator